MHYESWIDRREVLEDKASLQPVARLQASLDRPFPQADVAFPALRHWLYFLPAAPTKALGQDGHPKKGGFLPPIALPRRMFAGADIRFIHPIMPQAALTRQARIAAITEKQGQSGALVFVDIAYQIFADDRLAIEETQHIVYREAGARIKAVEPLAHWPSSAGNTKTRILQADPVLLFRFSALTFNSHRIHYDRDYAGNVEGYPGLVVHGPLLAMLLIDFAADYAAAEGCGDIAEFSFRARAPVFDSSPFRLEATPQGHGIALHIRRIDDTIAMQANVTWRP